MTPFLQMRNIIKRFPGVVANDNVNLTVEAGEIHALLGENGAGKSTLMNILYGLYTRDSGEILLDGQEVTFDSPADAIANGVGMIHQDFMLIPRFNVVENVVMGLSEEGQGALLDLKKAAERLRELGQEFGLGVDPFARVAHLSVGEEQRVEILKLLYRDARLLILDEPTAVLTPQEIEGFFKVLRALADQGRTIIFITHKLHEVMAISDRVTVLRDGRVAATRNTAETNPRKLAQLMVGREIVEQRTRREGTQGETVLQVRDLHVYNRAGRHKVRGVSFEIATGEILGLAGVEGNGQSELAEALLNLQPVRSGTVLLDGVDITHASPATHRRAGFGYVPADRRGVGSVGDLSIRENVMLCNLDRYTRWRSLFLDRSQAQERARELVQRYDVRTPGTDLSADKLSGGNLQKVVLGRELLHEPKMLVVEQPTRGLDIGAMEYVHEQLLAERERGTAILLISAELEEVMALSDRIAVIFEGELIDIVEARKADRETLGLLMGGTRPARQGARRDHS